MTIWGVNMILVSQQNNNHHHRRTNILYRTKILKFSH